MNKNISAIVSHIMGIAETTPDDRESVKLSRLANRLMHQGAPFEAPLTTSEIADVMFYLKGSSAPC